MFNHYNILYLFNISQFSFSASFLYCWLFTSQQWLIGSMEEAECFFLSSLTEFFFSIPTSNVQILWCCSPFGINWQIIRQGRAFCWKTSFCIWKGNFQCQKHHLRKLPKYLCAAVLSWFALVLHQLSVCGLVYLPLAIPRLQSVLWTPEWRSGGQRTYSAPYQSSVKL